MSNPISFDPLLVAYLARELDERLAGAAFRALPYFVESRALLLPLDHGRALRWDLHPQRGWLRLVPMDPSAIETEGDLVCTGIHAPADERRLDVGLREEGRFRSQSWRLVVELHTNQWNALLLEATSGRILSALRPRSAGGRQLRPGALYEPPPPRERVGTDEITRESAAQRWRATIDAAAPAERRAELLRGFAYTGALNAGWILGAAAQREDGSALEEAFDRWWGLRSLPPAAPVVVRTDTGPQPYPLPLDGIPSEPAASLLAAMATCAEAAESTDPHPGTPGAATAESALLLAAARERLRTEERRVEALRAQLARAGEADTMRAAGDLLLAHLHRVPRGAESVLLPDWDGGEVEIALDPSLSPSQNAQAWYDRARRHSRALERVPLLLAAAEADAQRWKEAVASAAESAELPAWAMETLERASATEGRPRGGEAPAPPYRRYRTSGGLEVRVGRNSKDNDRLTFAHSAPGDIWLHARSVPGSHVILRWTDPEGSPPPRDLEEAAALAALFSKARTSALVPVDWTRRKYVRKPRGAPPGAVIPQRVRTLFVEPDPKVEERLREQEG